MLPSTKLLLLDSLLQERSKTQLAPCRTKLASTLTCTSQGSAAPPTGSCLPGTTLPSRSTSPLWTSPPAARPEASPPTPSAAPSAGWVRATTASTGLPRRMASLTRSSKSVLSPDLLIIEIHEFNDLCVNLMSGNEGFVFLTPQLIWM